MSWHISSTRFQLGNFCLLDWYSGILFQIPCAGFGVWAGKYSDGGSWEVVID